MALGLLTDIASEVFLTLGAEGREKLWPLIAKQFLVWCVGRPLDIRENRKNGMGEVDVWWPCEALVRVACHEMQRLPERVTGLFPGLYQFERIGWTGMFLTMFSDALTKTVEHEKALEKDLFRARRQASNPDESLPAAAPAPEIVVEPETHADSDSCQVGACVDTPYGQGQLLKKRRDCYKGTDGPNYVHLKVNEIVLDFGGTLYRPDPNSVTIRDSEEPPTDETDKKAAKNVSLDLESNHIGKCLVIFWEPDISTDTTSD